MWLDWLDLKWAHRHNEWVNGWAIGLAETGENEFDQNTYDHLIEMRDANAHTTLTKHANVCLTMWSAYARPTRYRRRHESIRELCYPRTSDSLFLTATFATLCTYWNISDAIKYLHWCTDYYNFCLYEWIVFVLSLFLCRSHFPLVEQVIRSVRIVSFRSLFNLSIPHEFALHAYIFFRCLFL